MFFHHKIFLPEPHHYKTLSKGIQKLLMPGKLILIGQIADILMKKVPTGVYSLL